MKNVENQISGVTKRGFCWISDINDIIFQVNNGIEVILGISKYELIGSNVLKDFTEEPLKSFRILYLKAKASLETLYFDTLRLEMPSKKTIYLSGWLVPMMKEGKFNGMICTMKDVTEKIETLKKLRASNRVLKRKLDEKREKLRISEKEYQELFNNINCGVAVYEAKDDGEDFIFVDFNLAAERIEQVKKEDIIGKSIIQVFPGVKEFGLFKVFQRVWRTGKPEVHPDRLYKDHRIEGWRRNYVYKLPTGKVVAVYSDVTRQKISEQKLTNSEKRYKEAYDLANFYKDLLAHDMNNILQAIISSLDYYELIKNASFDSKESENIIKNIRTHTKRGARLISNVRKLVKLEKMTYRLYGVDVQEELEKAIRNTIKSFNDKNVKISLKRKIQDMEVKVLANDLLIDIFDNLLNNAVKFNYNEKEIIVDIIISEVNIEGIEYIKFEFIDRGIGIPEERKKNLFIRAYNKDISKRRMGLGLSLVQKIITMYGGKIWVENRVEGDYSEGSNFIVLLKKVS
ncbi:MAG: PAS domain-containing sensor histidine kinase [Promethearchaeota archaeon]